MTLRSKRHADHAGQAFELVVEGKTTVEEVIRSVYAPGADAEDEAPKALPAGKRELKRGMDMLTEGRRRGNGVEASPPTATPGEPIAPPAPGGPAYHGSGGRRGRHE